MMQALRLFARGKTKQRKRPNCYLDALAIAATVALAASRILGSESSTRRIVVLAERVGENEA